MPISPRLLFCFVLLSSHLLPVFADAIVSPQAQTSGVVITVSAYGEVKHVNDEALVIFMIEEQDKDKALAASRVNQKMKQGMDILRREDPQGILKTRSYYSYPIYPEDQGRGGGRRVLTPISWRIGQYLELNTTNVASLSKTVASVQRVLSVNGVQFGLTERTRKSLDEQRIVTTYKNLNDRISAIAKAMGRHASEAVVEAIDFDGSANFLPQTAAVPKALMHVASQMETAPVEEPSLEPGETALEMRIVGKVKFK